MTNLQPRVRRGVAVLAAGLLAAALAGCQGAAPLTPAPAPAASLATTPAATPAPGSSTSSPATTSTSAALAQLAGLAVKGPAPMTGYSRAKFGPAWADEDHNGCDTRNDVLRRDLTDTTLKAGTHGCVVLTGVLVDPYTARTIDFTRGSSTSTAVEIDHVVALADAWRTGAQAWSPARREQYANDPLVLLAVDGPTNEAKGDGDAATWLPPNKAYRCTYAARQVTIKSTYSLWVTPAEHDALERILHAC
jgi:hypothetical protein